jgi:N-acetylglucosaminyl-diphospho-decaprenol L-rhamnosyltransferase
MSAPPKLTVVLVSYNTKALLLDLLLRLAPAPWLTCVVVDNASADGSADAVASELPSVALIRNPENVGFARAANQGLAKATSPYIALVNPDTDTTPEFLLELVEFLETHAGVWAVAPRLIGSDGKAQTLAAGFSPTPLRALLYFLGLSYILPWPSSGFSVSPRIRKPVEVDWLSGACLVLRRDVIDRVGPLDSSFFLYGEDMEWCRRMRAAGGRLVMLGDHDLGHARAASSGHEVESTKWLDALVRYVRPQTSATGAKLFFTAAAIGFWIRGSRFVLPRQRSRRDTLWRYAAASARIAFVPSSTASPAPATPGGHS